MEIASQEPQETRRMKTRWTPFSFLLLHGGGDGERKKEKKKVAEQLRNGGEAVAERSQKLDSFSTKAKMEARVEDAVIFSFSFLFFFPFGYLFIYRIVSKCKLFF